MGFFTTNGTNFHEWGAASLEHVIVDFNLEKAFEPRISRIHTDYQGLAEFMALKLRARLERKRYLIRNLLIPISIRFWTLARRFNL